MTQPQPQPSYILRGHGAQIHSTSFLRRNSRLITGDAEGWVVIWGLAIKRPVAVWRAHEGSILGAEPWGDDKIITHGKDNKLIVWKFSEEDEESMSVVLPVNTPDSRKQPWLLHVLEVNTMNFCPFAACLMSSQAPPSSAINKELLVAVPNILTSKTVDIFHLPSSNRIHAVPNKGTFKGGMIMTISIFHHPQTGFLTVIAGYENGNTTVSQLSSNDSWKMLYSAHTHSQPILSLQVEPSKQFYVTSSADAIIAKHPIPMSLENTIMNPEDRPLKVSQTKHSGQQGLKMRDDGKIFATAGWDSKVRVYSAKSLKELAVLKWHKEGCFAVAFASIETTQESEGNEKGEENEGGLIKTVGTMTVKEERLWKAKMAHWIAVGSKDGKVSLWDIY
ncbi:WD40-repeat-containing domain protein [Amylocarpus encephaloides]|uniref:ASTRA-associated protein 1 n=1 Tax=Amylocarpus encephaloides TaxID=45428 RepID=A0A9P8C724_9HELO|nr:WD40-repeat-containing domain protein [Amylocarpus encephaloides]